VPFAHHDFGTLLSLLLLLLLLLLLAVQSHL
jgi:hypothetical protein